MQFNTDFIDLYEELSKMNELTTRGLTESSVPEYTTARVDLSSCREVVSSCYNSIRNEYEASSVTMINGRLSRVEVRTFVLRKDENGEIFFLGRPCRGGKGYTTPGGGFDLADGTPLKTATRELWEELNLNLENAQESAIHTFTYGNKPWPFVRDYVENPEDQWTGYYQYYVTAEYGGKSDNQTPEELGKYKWFPISVFENPADKAGSTMLQIIEGHKWYGDTTDVDLDEAFDNEEVYGEAARTIPGVLRYFAQDLPTLNIILSSGKIRASKIKEADPNKLRGTKQHVRRPFVSFSHQLFSHAYRAPRWRYGVAISEEKLKQKIETLDTHDKFKHDSKTVTVYGAAKLSDGSELIITSFGSFAMNLSDKQRKLLGDIPKTDFYDQVKELFYKYNAKNIEKCSEDPAVVDAAIKAPIDAEVLEGFIMTGDLRPSVGVKFKKIYDLVPGLHDYLQDHTALDEGEFRMWLPDDMEYLDISNCIVGVVLPSNYVQHKFANQECSESDTEFLREFVTQNNLELFVYDSEKITRSRLGRAPHIKGGRAGASAEKMARPTIDAYFKTITSSYEAAVSFIKNELSSSKQAITDYSARYNSAMGRLTSAPTAEVSRGHYKYRDFLNAIKDFDIVTKDIPRIIETGEPFRNPVEVFNDITTSADSVFAFIKQLAAECPTAKALSVAYVTWFRQNTKAVFNTSGLQPEEVSLNNLVKTCEDKFNITRAQLLQTFNEK